MRRLAATVMTAQLSMACAAARSGGTGATTPVRGAAGPDGAGGGADAAGFAALVDAYFEAKLAFEPSSGTAAGLHRYDSALEDWSAARIAARVSELHATVQRLDALPLAALAAADRIDARFLAAQARADLLDLEGLGTWRWNPMRYAGLPGASVDALMKRDFAPAAERARAMAARMRAVPGLYAAARANLTDPPPELNALALRLAKGSVGFFERAIPTWTEGAALDMAARRELEAARAGALDATRAFAAWLERDLGPRAHGRFALGAARFAEKLRIEEMIDRPLPELLAAGRAQLARDHAAFVATAARIAPGRSPGQVMATLTADHPAARDLVPFVAGSVEETRAFVEARGLVTLPSAARPRVEETPPYARAAVFASMDTPGPYETRPLPAYYYVTPVEPDWPAERREEHLRAFNRWNTALTNIHEAFPGHFVQFLYAPRFPTKTRKLLATMANVEGWAHYAEQMMVDEGFGGGDPRMRLAQLQEALVRDCRFVAAIEMHTNGMTVDQAARLFETESFSEPANAREEAMRGTYDPMYLAYTLGKLEIQRLRDDYRARADGSLRAFHDAFVAQGGLPLPLMRELLLP